jgi:hypothetical protein
MNSHDGIPLFLRGIYGGRREEITGAVDDDIDSAEILDSRVDDLFRTDNGGDAIVTGDGLTAQLFYFSYYYIGSFGTVGFDAGIGDDDTSPFGGHCQDYAPPNSTAAARDDCYFTD